MLQAWLPRRAAPAHPHQGQSSRSEPGRGYREASLRPLCCARRLWHLLPRRDRDVPSLPRGRVGSLCSWPINPNEYGEHARAGNPLQSLKSRPAWVRCRACADRIGHLLGRFLRNAFACTGSQPARRTVWRAGAPLSPPSANASAQRSFGSSASRRPSPMKLKQNRVTARKAAG
jgi:hypothetical protein